MLNETNVNDTNAAPAFTGATSTGTGGASAYSFDYAENQASGATVGTVAATDPENNALTFSITGGNSNGWYAINPTTGAITLTAAGAASVANDYEQNPNTQTLTVAVSDGTNTTTIEVKLNETNVLVTSMKAELARLQPELTLLLDLLVSVPALICMILICIIRAAEAPENTTAAHFMAVAGLPTACLM